ncbi:DUF1028 domain-containing protein [Pseudoclavibacter chungangensis]|uniref:DUF1028 domain-containing protein n=1 Tax=Pseudoclavibacter chungangensis TaxID=587635 RepID=A0A7J5BQ57_9MICO|nr:DUF1028 domain-containing protein [Pseudoclavibacter chungangensis]KAB1655678.1 DUF1028 domain-containing protein [Pseudoclavibacter chungangensis]NYJ67910.1 putative Ntn-hydrolase superfamily protein [Pseudoclavibacter chungangensis]
MTFSLAARDPQTGAFGMIISSSSPAVASRCVNLRPGVGAAASQNVTNPALGPAVLDRLAAGRTAHEAIDAVIETESHPEFRQLTAVDADGRTRVFSGDRALGIVAARAVENAVAAGNMLASEAVIDAYLDGYLASTAATFEERLLEGFAAALAAGGEAGPVRSAGIAVVEDVPWRVTDLRVDDHDDPGAELARLVALWLPQKADYRTRGIDPTAAPSYGVPGDE